jgi:cytochrome oxidase assembly protein ShyY1
MTSRQRPPVVLTVAAAIVFVVCFGLGVWQLQRAAWKTHELARVAGLKHAAPIPLEPLFAQMAKGDDLTFTRVVVDCLPADPGPAQSRLVSDKGEWIARLLSACQLDEPPYQGIVIDRGFLAASRGQPNPPAATLPAPEHVSGVLYPRASSQMAGLSNPAPFVLVVEQEMPSPTGVTPAPYPDAGDNLQYVGAYWLTWFGLAGAVAVVYAAMLWRRSHPKP